MADEPDNLILIQLREIRATLAEHGAALGLLSKEISELRGDVRTLKSALKFAVGSAGLAEHQSLQALQTAEETRRYVDELMGSGDKGPASDA